MGLMWQGGDDKYGRLGMGSIVQNGGEADIGTGGTWRREGSRIAAEDPRTGRAYVGKER